MFLGVLIILFINNLNAEYIGSEVFTCGSNSIPYLLTVDSSGHPELYCDLPNCLFSTGNERKKLVQALKNNENNLIKPNNNDNDDEPNFNNEKDSINKKLRQRRNINNNNINNLKINNNKQIAQCSNHLTESACSLPNYWTGSIAEWNNGTHISLEMDCCYSNELNNAYELSIIEVHPGQKYEGGIIIKNERQIGFDLIKEIRKKVDFENRVVYIIKVYRMLCNTEIKSKADRIFEESENLTISNDRLRPSPSMLRMALAEKKRSQSYLKQIRMANLIASEKPAEQHDSYLTQKHKINDLNLHERRYHPNYKPNKESQDLLNNLINRQSFNSPEQNKENFFYDINDDLPNQNFNEQKKINFAKLSNEQHQKRLPIRLASNTKPNIQMHSKLFNTNEIISDEPKSDKDYQVLDTSTLSIIGSNERQSSNKELLEQYFNNHPTENIVVESPQQSSNSLESQPSSFIPMNNGYEVLSPAYQEQSDCSCAAPQLPCAAGQSCCCDGPTLNDASSSLQCFSGDMIVKTRDNGIKRIDELEIGEHISYSPIVMFLHRKPNEDAIYYNLQTENNKKLKLTKYHLIYVVNCNNAENVKLVQARRLKVGDCIYTLIEFVDNKNYRFSLESSKIIQIFNNEEKGIYAPLTANGNIVVNEILASCHSNIAAQTLQQTFFGWWRTINKYFIKILKYFNIKQFYNTFDLFINVIEKQFIKLQQFIFSKNNIIFLNKKQQQQQQQPQQQQKINIDFSFVQQQTNNISCFVNLKIKQPIKLNNFDDDDGELPFGVEYLTQIIDIILPVSLF